MRPFSRIAGWLIARLAPMRGRRSILVSDQSGAGEPFCFSVKSLAQHAVMTCSVSAALIFFFATPFACSGTLAAEPKRVLVLHSFGRDFTPWKEYASAIRLELQRQSPWPLDIHDQSLVSTRFSDEDPEVPFLEYLRALYRKMPPDLIVGIGAPAVVFVQRHRPQIFPKAPMVFTALEQRRSHNHRRRPMRRHPP